MATTGAFLGRTFGVYVGTVLMLYSRSNNLSLTADNVDITTKDSVLWGSILPTVKSWSVSIDGLVALNSAKNADKLIDLLIAGTQATVKFSTATSGDVYYWGKCYITSVEITAPNADVVTYSATFSGDGALATATKT